MGLFGNKTETDAISLLKEDHEQVKELFERFEEADDRRTKQQIVSQALKALKVHTQIEEEIFYPAVRKADADDEEIDDLMDEAFQEHHVAKILISELEDMNPGDKYYDAKFTVLAESVKHHIEEEESDIFPKVEDDADWEKIGGRMKERKQELLAGGGRSANGRSKGARNMAQGKRAATKTGHLKAVAKRK